MKQKIFAIGLAAMLLAASSLGAAAIGVQTRMSLASAAQAKQVTTVKKLTDSQYEALRGELMQLFNFPELSSGNVNRKEMTLELEVVGQASTGLQSRIKELEKEYGVDSKISIVEGYESAELPLAEDPVENNNAFAEQVKEQLGKESYTSITVAGSRITIGVPSVESIEKIEVLRQTFEEQEELSPVDYLLCRYSCQQLEEAKAAVDKELADIAKEREVMLAAANDKSGEAFDKLRRRETTLLQQKEKLESTPNDAEPELRQAKLTELQQQLNLVAQEKSNLERTNSERAYQRLAVLKSQELQLSAEKDGLADQCTPALTVENLARVIELWTKIPASQIQEQEYERLAHLEERLKTHIIGQDEAVHEVANAIRRGRVGLKDIKTCAAGAAELLSGGGET